MELNELPLRAGEWLRGEGPQSDIVISSRARLARNVAGFPFATRAKPVQLEELRAMLTRAIRHVRPDATDIVCELGETPEIDRQFLHERHLISREHAEGGGHGGRTVVFGSDEIVSVMVNEEDHLRLQVVRSGFQLEETYTAVAALDRALAGHLDFAYDREFGFLTACPTNVGTGLRASVMLHLPALTLKRQIDKALEAAAKCSFVVRGTYGEGTRPVGHFYQVSNQVTLGRQESELVGELARFVAKTVEFERRLRDTLVEDERARLEDRVWRSYGILRTARIISAEETMDHLSDIRLGINLGMITDVPLGTVNELFVLAQPAHLQKLHGEALEANARDESRAKFIRSRLAAFESPN